MTPGALRQLRFRCAVPPWMTRSVVLPPFLDLEKARSGISSRRSRIASHGRGGSVVYPQQALNTEPSSEAT